MDARLQGDPQLRFAVNGGAAAPNARLGPDDTLHFLTQEEKECIQFFENTIESLDEGLEDAPRRAAQVRTTDTRSPPAEEMDGPPRNTSMSRTSHFGIPTGPKDQDIIDLVQPDPDLVQIKEPTFSPISPDFQSMLPTPESHFEIKPRRDPADSLPSEYNPPLPSGTYGAADSHSYHPPGCIPTPIMIAQKIAENQGGGPSTIDPSAVLRRLSTESDKPSGHNADLLAKQGPPTSAKPSRYPANISVVLANKDYQTQSLANVNFHERRALMLSNLSGTSHPLVQENTQPAADQKTRNVPKRSISFRDPTPDKSRLEALSKLGLNRGRAMSGGTSLFTNQDGTKLKLPIAGHIGARSLETSPSPTSERKMLEVPSPPYVHPQFDRKAEVLRSDSRRSYEERSPQLSPSPTSLAQNSYYPSHLDTKPSVSPPPGVTSIEINSYGGKSIVVNPSVTSRAESSMSPPPPESKSPPPVLPSPTEFNSYGGKSRVVNLSPTAITRNDLPDILSSHIDKSQPTPVQSEPLPARHSAPPSRSHKAPPPGTAPKPTRHSYQAGITQQLVAARALSPDHRRKPNSIFRPQSITVEFSGQGPMDESRRSALRKLGLLKDS